MESYVFKPFILIVSLILSSSIKCLVDTENKLDYLFKRSSCASCKRQLKPFDLINPYRLDFIMKTKMGNLYNFWKDDIAKNILKDTDFIVNLASDEFSKTVRKYISENQILDFGFYEKVDGKLKKHSTISKKARGMMLNFMTKNKIENIEDIKKFDKDGYEFVEEMSLENKFVFVKNI